MAASPATRSRAAQKKKPRPKSQAAEQSEHEYEVVSFAQGLKQQYLMCRTYGHSWMPYTVHQVRDVEGAPNAYFEQTLRCKCRVRRIFLLNESAQVLRQRHDYSEAPGYLSQGIGRLVGADKDRLRKVAILRLINSEEAA